MVPFLVLVIGLAGCGREPLYRQQSFVFGTMVEITLYGEDEVRAKELAGHVLADFDRLHRMFHAWKPGPLNALNDTFAQAPAEASIEPELAAALEDAGQYSRQSDGLFNPAIGDLIRLWGFQNDEFLPVRPDPAEIARLLKANPQMADIAIVGNRAHSTNPAVRVDLGGYAKGYALDLAARYLRTQGVKNALVNIGGNIIALGQHGGRPWQVGIQHPRKPGAIATLELRNGEAVGTSGDYQRYFEQDGKRYCHIIDPRTGWPGQGVQAVTVLVPGGDHAGTLSDVASKPIFLSGRDGWREAARRMGVDQAMLVDGTGDIYLTASMKRRLHFTEAGVKLHEQP